MEFLHPSPHNKNKQQPAQKQHFRSASSGASPSLKLWGWPYPVASLDPRFLLPAGLLLRTAAAQNGGSPPTRGQTGQKWPQTALGGPRAGSATLRGQLGAHGTQLGRPSMPLLVVARLGPLGAVLGAGEPKKLPNFRLSSPNRDSGGTFPRYNPPLFVVPTLGLFCSGCACPGLHVIECARGSFGNVQRLCLGLPSPRFPLLPPGSLTFLS